MYNVYTISFDSFFGTSFSKKNNFACFAFHLLSLCQSNIIKKFSSNSNVLSSSKTEEKMTK